MKRVLTAEETPDCPPHFWRVDSFNVGRCAKCPAIRDFGKLQNSSNGQAESKARASAGGKKRLFLPRKDQEQRERRE